MTGWLLSATALVAAALVLRRVLRRHLHPAVLYALWLLAAARLLLPFTVGTSDLSLSAAASALPLVRQAEALLPVDTGSVLTPAVLESRPLPDSAPTEDDTPETAAVPWTKVVAAVWIGGSAVTLAWLLAVNGRCYARLRRSRRPLDAGRDLPCYVYVSAAIDTPCLLGQSIYVTPQVAADETALRHVLAHEASAVKRLGEGERTAYGRTLIALSCAQTRPVSPLTAATTMSGGRRTLKERVCLLAKQPHTRAAAAFVLAAAVILAAVAGFTGETKDFYTIRARRLDDQTVRLSVTGGQAGQPMLLMRVRYHNGEGVEGTPSLALMPPNRSLDITLLDTEGEYSYGLSLESNTPVRCPTTDWTQVDPALGYVWTVMEGTLRAAPGSMYPIAWCGYAEDGNIDPLPVQELTESTARIPSQKGDYFVVWAMFPRADGYIQTGGAQG